jgi:hypothetical protein
VLFAQDRGLLRRLRVERAVVSVGPSFQPDPAAQSGAAAVETPLTAASCLGRKE